MCMCDFSFFFFLNLLTRPEYQTHITVRGLTEIAAFDASQGIYEINNRPWKQGEWITRGWDRVHFSVAGVEGRCGWAAAG